MSVHWRRNRSGRGASLVSLAGLAVLTGGAAPRAATERLRVVLADLVPPESPLAVHDLTLDARHAALGIEYARAASPELLREMAALPATEHLLRHARTFDNEDAPRESTEALTRHLASPADGSPLDAAACSRSLAVFTGPMQDDPRWIGDVLRYLPADFRFRGALYLTFGYDIGVAEGATASLNCAHRFFRESPRELIYYAVHELHHVGFMSYQPSRPLSKLRTYADLAAFVAWATQMEGMAVWAAEPRRRAEGALGSDGSADYLALQDEARLDRLEDVYFRELDALKARGDATAGSDSFLATYEAFAKERLWYRIGARMARRIEEAEGRPALVALVREGPQRFLADYRLRFRRRTTP